jgi:hypothetical protein
MLNAFASAILQVACLVTPVLALFLYTLIRFTVEELVKRHQHHQYVNAILHNVMVHELDRHSRL